MPLQEHPNLIPLGHNETLWRYLELDKFERLLKNKALFFCRADMFVDPFEGSIPKAEYDFRMEQERRAAAYLGYEFNEEQALDNIAGLSNLHKQLRRAHVVNCWNISDTDSDAMWRLYMSGVEGVAIQTSGKRLYRMVDNSSYQLYVSKVRYIDYDKDGWYHPVDYPHGNYNLLMPLIHKRKQFKHESEVRVLAHIREAEKDELYWEAQPIPKGVNIEVDVVDLIEKVILPPSIDEKTRRRIEDLASGLGYSFQFEVSALNNEVYF